MKENYLLFACFIHFFRHSFQILTVISSLCSAELWESTDNFPISSFDFYFWVAVKTILYPSAVYNITGSL